MQRCPKKMSKGRYEYSNWTMYYSGAYNCEMCI